MPEPLEPMVRAALFAGRAPSVHNSQPWHWYARPDRLELRLERGRVLPAGDPRARLAILSCGTAPHHGGDRSFGSGIPATALPVDPYRTARAALHLMHRPGSALIAESHHHVALFALLSTSGDGRLDWLAAGQALSAGWLTATALDVAVLPLSIVTEVPASRDRLRTLLPSSGNPQLALRPAAAGSAPGSPTPRLPAEAFVSRQP